MLLKKVEVLEITKIYGKILQHKKTYDNINKYNL